MKVVKVCNAKMKLFNEIQEEKNPKAGNSEGYMCKINNLINLFNVK
jgi:hypothetical protein